MPQCSKCGREISQYGVCPHCSRKTSSINTKPLRCPYCGSTYCKVVDGKTKCTMCGKTF